MDLQTVRRRVRRKRRRWERFGWRKMVARPAHELRWRLSSPEAIEGWTEERLAPDGAYWLFLLGLNNSGTSILRNLLASHPEVRSLPTEGQLLTPALPLGPQHGVGRNWTKRLDVFRLTEADDPEPARRARYDWAWLYEPGRGILLEKSPPNTIRSRWLQANFRPARFLAITRHPYAVCEGIRRRTGLPLEDGARHWTVGNELLLEDAGHLDECLMLTYEELTERTDDVLREAEGFLGLRVPIDRALLERPIPMHNIGGRPQRIQNLNARSVERLADEELAAIDAVAGPLMERLGYARGRQALELISE